MKNTAITKLLNIEIPMIMAPMYFVTNQNMIIEAMNCGIAACMPAINWEDEAQMRVEIKNIKQSTNKGALGISILNHASNEKIDEQLNICLEEKIDFIISALDCSKEIISKAQKAGIKVFCEARNVEEAENAQNFGADAIIAVNEKASGFCGNLSAEEFIPLLKKSINIPIITFGGIGEGNGFYKALNNLEADACMIGSVFIASKESEVPDSFKKLCFKYSDKDVVQNFNVFGIRTNVLKTPYIRRSGAEQGILIKLLLKISFLQPFIIKKIFQRGIKTSKIAISQRISKTICLAGSAIKYSKNLNSVSNIINSISASYTEIDAKKKVMSRSISR